MIRSLRIRPVAAAAAFSLQPNTTACFLALSLGLASLHSPAAPAAGVSALLSAPDAGSLLQQQQQAWQGQDTRLAPQTWVAPDRSGPALKLPNDAPVLVLSFELQGNQQIGLARLQAGIKALLGRKLDAQQLQAAADRVCNIYARAGWLARCYLPAQEFLDGLVRIQIVEAHLGDLRLDGSTSRYDANRANAIFLLQQPSNAKSQRPPPQDGMLLFGDLPGRSSSADILASSDSVDRELLLALADLPDINAQAGVDNHVDSAVGKFRFNTGLTMDGSLGMSDTIAAGFSHSKGSDYLRLAASLPLARWRLGAGISMLRYRLIGNDYSAGLASGQSEQIGLDASYALIRRRERNLNLQLGLERRRLRDRGDGNNLPGITVNDSDYRTLLFKLGLTGNWFDALGRGGSNTASMELSRGKVDPSKPSAGSTGSGVNSNFTKLRLHVSRQQVLSDSLQGFIALSVQSSRQNLDSSERFYLGGPYGVRAYAAGGAGGSTGSLLSVELRSQLTSDFRAAVFYDWGRIQLNVNGDAAQSATTPPATPPTASPELNRASMQGLGLNLSWSGPAGIDVRATLARRVGSAPPNALLGLDLNSPAPRNQMWLQASMPF
ncbi:BamA/TamA family outer membrane protein [Paucibacter sp. B2R-40]|uniref:ShlB/FhaC/HecB family hemolysin secretion/activation protein n=1 Tax=Paucibacter sp. B2R-40 TaxID=2893554 RepID=UPI0021E501AE|nr:ShlB/FhaC/HecB family hemolysin secretion/activation protein [Paucibacter sp. B2R-40]MCV2355703.1 BamA/TamA family outer membrane protein [Paucibacter sp. B2R-40]